MPTDPALLDAVRVQIYRQFLDTGRAPAATEIAHPLSRDASEIEDSFIALAAARVIVLAPGTRSIWMAHPFSAVPTPHRVQSGGTSYWVNCAWLVAAETLNDRVLPFYEEHGVRLLRILTDRGTEFCGNRESHEYQLYLALENIDHTRTKARSPQTNGICERFHRALSRRNSTAWRSGRSCIAPSMNSKRTWMSGSVSTMNVASMQGNIAMARRPCRSSWIPSTSRTKRCSTN